MNILNYRFPMAGPFIIVLGATCCMAQQLRVPQARHVAPAASAKFSVPLVAPPPCPAVNPSAENAGPAATLSVCAQAQRIIAGVPIVVVVTALDAKSQIVSNYNGDIQLASDKAATINAGSPVDGHLTFAVVFKSLGQQTLTATDKNQTSITGKAPVTVVSQANCEWIPIRTGCISSADDINNYYSMAQGASYFGQIRSIYNGAANAATVSADVATLNFLNGMQFTAGTNIQAGTSTSASPQTPNAGTAPTLTAAGSAQAAQNMLYGGTFVVSASYPLLGFNMTDINTAGNLTITLDLFAREGFDIQNFQANTTTQVTSPPSHSSAQMVGYLVYNAINPATSSAGASSGFAGSVFLGGAYGYSYTSHSYTLDYGIPNVSNGLGQISAGMLVNGVVKIAVSRGFGPSQTYHDSATSAGASTTVNNFKAWSIGITYQAPAPAAK